MKVILVLIPMVARPMIRGSNVIKVTAKIFLAVASRPILGSLRIDDFCTATPLGHIIVPSRRLVEILIYDSQSDDDVGARAANFPAISEVCLFGFFFNFLFTSRLQFKPKCLTSDKRELVLHTLIETA